MGSHSAINALRRRAKQTSFQTTGKTLSAIALGAAAGTIGASVARDVYKGAKREHPLIIFAFVSLVSVVWLVYDLARGRNEFSFGALALRFVAVIISVLWALYVLANLNSGFGQTLLAITMIACLAAYFLGISARREREMEQAVVNHNDNFLEENGSQDVGGKDSTFIDGEENELMLDDVRRDAIVFRVARRRGVRAYIALDETGRMVEYSGVPERR